MTDKARLVAGVNAPHYCKRIPTQAELPAGSVLVHNHVGRPAIHQGTRGFRYWTQAPTAQLVRCDCGWAPELPEHYRVGAV